MSVKKFSLLELQIRSGQTEGRTQSLKHKTERDGPDRQTDVVALMSVDAGDAAERIPVRDHYLQ